MLIVRGSCVFAMLLVLSSGAVWAQGTAELAGLVRDESGAVLPGVTVTATQTDTGFTRTVVTDGAGAYRMPNLPTGRYRLEVSLQGFRSYVQTGIVLQVGATPTVNAVLGLGSLEETVTVEAATPIVDVRNAGISEVVEQERILALPLQGMAQAHLRQHDNRAGKYTQAKRAAQRSPERTHVGDDRCYSDDKRRAENP
jgi:hypothetical protein